MRIAFTIIYEGRHHLEHLHFAERMATMFDHWVVVEGHSRPYGSTRWCNRISVPPQSQDGTVEFMQEFSKENKNVHFYSNKDYYFGKDNQVNTAIEIIKKITNKCFLWEVDADEHWNINDIVRAEKFAALSPEIGFGFQFNQFVGDGLVATGSWGSGWLNRLWKWEGQYFKSHEPAMLEGQRVVAPIEGIKFDHYSYYFEKDVKFKSLYYKDHEKVHQLWKMLPDVKSFPIHISKLFGVHSRIGKSKSFIHKISDHDNN